MRIWGGREGGCGWTEGVHAAYGVILVCAV